MLLERTADQDFLRETTDRFLGKEAGRDDLRALRHDQDGFDRSYWRRGADLGWTSLLVEDEHGGGSVSGRGLIDLTLIAHEFGRHGAPGPLLPTNIVAAALSAQARGEHSDVLDGIVTGTTIAGWAFEGGPGSPFGTPVLAIASDGAEVVISGCARPVEAGAQADCILATGRTGDGISQVLVPTDAPGLSIEPIHSVDLTRRFSIVRFDEVRLPAKTLVGEIGRAARQVERQLRQALAIQCAESVGSMDMGFQMTVEWAFDRYSFGRPLASYQALKHRFADMKSWLEGSHAVADAAAEAAESQSPDAAELSSAAKAFIGHYGSELLQDCVQLHGGIGVTFEHDLHIFLRRLTLNRMLLGTPADHRRLLAELAFEQTESP